MSKYSHIIEESLKGGDLDDVPPRKVERHHGYGCGGKVDDEVPDTEAFFNLTIPDAPLAKGEFVISTLLSSTHSHLSCADWKATSLGSNDDACLPADVAVMLQEKSVRTILVPNVVYTLFCHDTQGNRASFHDHEFRMRKFWWIGYHLTVVSDNIAQGVTSRCRRRIGALGKLAVHLNLTAEVEENGYFVRVTAACSCKCRAEFGDSCISQILRNYGPWIVASSGSKRLNSFHSLSSHSGDPRSFGGLSMIQPASLSRLSFCWPASRAIW